MNLGSIGLGILTGGISEVVGAIGGALTPNIPGLPAPLPLPLIPTIDQAQQRRQQQDRLRRRRGRATTVLTGSMGAEPDAGSVATATLLGG